MKIRERRGRPPIKSQLAGGIVIPKKYLHSIIEFYVVHTTLKNKEICKILGLPITSVTYIRHKRGFHRFPQEGYEERRLIDRMRELAKTHTRREIAEALGKKYNWTCERCRLYNIKAKSSPRHLARARPIVNDFGVDNSTIIRLYRILRIVCKKKVKEIVPILRIKFTSSASMNQRHVRDKYNYSPLTQEEKIKIPIEIIIGKKSLRFVSYKYNRPLRMIENFYNKFTGEPQ